MSSDKTSAQPIARDASMMAESQYESWNRSRAARAAITMALVMSWTAAQRGLAWDVTSTPDGEHWGCRLEVYHDEPGQDMSEWETELAFKLAG
jgi:hypothetical protein